MKKMMSFLSLIAAATFAIATGAITAEKDKILSQDPELSGAFRSDSTLRFMRHLRRADPIPDNAQHGPKYDSKKAQKAADKAADKQQPQEKFGSESAVKSAVKAGDAAGESQANPDAVGKAFESAVKDAVKGVDAAGDAVADSFRDAQKGPNADSKKAQKVAQQEDQGKKADGKAQDKSDKAAENESEKAEPGCKNSPEGWTDSKGSDCEDYAEGEWCDRHGGYGDAWLDEWGKFEDVAKKGKSALDACCVCGGGEREEEAPKANASAAAPGEAPAAAAPVKAAAPAPAAAPVPAIKGPILGTKAGRPLQEQGFHGDMVKHEDQETMTSDWGREFGPRAGQRDIKVICDEHPGNEWCSLHGYYDKPHSAACSQSMVAVLATLVLLSLQ